MIHSVSEVLDFERDLLVKGPLFSLYRSYLRADLGVIPHGARGVQPILTSF